MAAVATFNAATPLMRTVLFVPGSRPERFAKALAAGADAVIIDLEDAVEPDRKAAARDHIRDFVDQGGGAADTRFMVRVNDATTQWFADDLALCAQLPSVSAVVLPKAETADHVVQAFATGKPVLPIVENAQGVLSLSQLAAAPGVVRLSFGSLDFMLELGTTPDTEAAHGLLEHVRYQILMHSAANGLAQPLDGVFPDFSDTERLHAHAQHIRHMGFGGALCIHPAQIAPIHAAFAPSAAERDWAQRVVDIADRTGSSAFQLDGKMVDVPVIRRARQIVAMDSNATA